VLFRSQSWCPGEDSNLHGSLHWYLKPARLPVPPPGPGRERVTRGHAQGAKSTYRLEGCQFDAANEIEKEAHQSKKAGLAQFTANSGPRPNRKRHARS